MSLPISTNNSRGAILILDKPEGPTSFDMVRLVKRHIKGFKVGHAGTLDPFASGVLILLLGEATRFSNAIMEGEKSYLARIKLGEKTTTLDPTGPIIQKKAIPKKLDDKKIQEGLNTFLGVWEQTPPMHSAKKVKGVRLYKLARKNIVIERKKSPVNIYEATLVKYEKPFIEVFIRCSKGTYIRSFAEDFAERLETVGFLQALKRVQSGAFKLDHRVELQALASDPIGALEKGVEVYHYWKNRYGYLS